MTPRTWLFRDCDVHRGAFEGTGVRAACAQHDRLLGLSRRGWEATELIGPSTNAVVAALGLVGVRALERRR